MLLYLVRHGQTDWNRLHRIQGHSDTPLNETGRAQAQALARTFAEKPLSAVYSSPLRRARDTAEAIARVHRSPDESGRHGLSVRTLDELKELQVGALDGVTLTEMRERYGDFLARWRRDASVRLPGGGETLVELQARAWPAIQRIGQVHAGEQVAVVTHSFLMQVVISAVLGLPLDHFRRVRVSEGGVSTVEFSSDSRPRLVAMNDCCHLSVGARSGYVF
ncbi:MAG: histidine phosphatase family protein [Dehalococcoidia bacterium]|nr:histidine phosphatase family protein [Dehalococcoidia bacterium]